MASTIVDILTKYRSLLQNHPSLEKDIIELVERTRSNAYKVGVVAGCNDALYAVKKVYKKAQRNSPL